MRRSAVLPALALLAVLLTAAPALATSLPTRTLRASITPDGVPVDGGSTSPVLSASGRVLAFDTAATNAVLGDENGAQRDVVAIDLATNERRLVSQGPAGVGGDGPSTAPAMSRDGQRIVFVSEATNLVEGDTNGVADVFFREGRGPIVRLSTTPTGVEADGPSTQPDVSGDGRFIVFASSATNLVDGDTNGQPDVFVRDLAQNTIARVSVTNAEGQAAAGSGNPAISADGSAVAFSSGAANLVAKDNNGLADVFVRDLEPGRTERVSVSSSGRQQNRSVAPGFTQVADLTADGDVVVFDSDATTLVRGDTNRHTDVFLRDRDANTTQLVSASSLNVQGDNDSFAPRVTGNGRFLTFQSFATNLAPGNAPREDVFLRDLRQGTTSLVNATADGATRLGELVPQLLQRPAVSDNGQFAAFSSTVTNLVGGDGDQNEDVFVRLLDPPSGRIVSRPRIGRSGTVRVAGDDRLATAALCRFDDGPVRSCRQSFRVRAGDAGVVRVRVGGAGMLWDPDELVVRLTRDRTGPRVRIANFSSKSRRTSTNLRTIRAKITDESGVRRVQVSITYVGARGCRYLSSRRRFRAVPRGNCNYRTFVDLAGTRNLRLRLPERIRGAVDVRIRAIDRLGNRGRTATLTGLGL